MDNTRKLKSAALAAFAIALFTILIHTTSAASATTFVLATPAPFLPINPNNWVPVALVAVLLVIGVAVFVYVLGGIMNSSHARAWAQAQIYEGIVSVVLLIIFVFFVYLFFINPVPALNNVGLVSSSSSCGANTVNTIFTLSACDMNFFNQNAFSVASTDVRDRLHRGVLPRYRHKRKHGAPTRGRRSKRLAPGLHPGRGGADTYGGVLRALLRHHTQPTAVHNGICRCSSGWRSS